METAEKRIYELLEFVLDASCTDEQRLEFARLIDKHPELTKKLTEDVFIHSLLQWQGEDVSRELQTDAWPLEGEGQFQSVAIGAEPRPSLFREFLPGWAGTLAASLLFIGLFFLVHRFTGTHDQEAIVAVAKITSSDGVIWSEKSSALRDGEGLVPGRLQTEGGEFTMEFRTGPVVRVQGPVSMMIESDMLVHLDRGQATARVPAELKGFTIKTPVIDVIDQGTEFGVVTRSNGFTDVVVFDGKVDLQDNISDEHAPTRLLQGEAARVNRVGAIQRIMQVGRNKQGAWWTDDYPGHNVNVIQEVRDNIIPLEESLQYFCYQITYAALQDDSLAYGDHPHQWNGLTGEGLPDFLRGADYVKTFNDYRYLDDFQMEVVLERPAHLYIMFDNRVPPPQWLTSQFDDTGIDIGLDEGPWPAGDKALRPDLPVYQNAVGGGQSIDNTFSVWRRDCSAKSQVVLGTMGEERQARAMYGIAATAILPAEITPQDSAAKESDPGKPFIK